MRKICQALAGGQHHGDRRVRLEDQPDVAEQRGGAVPRVHRRGGASCVRRGPQAVARDQHPGRAVQVNPIKPMLKAPGTKRLKLTYDEPLSSFAFKFNLCRYTPPIIPVELPLKVGRDTWIMLAALFITYLSQYPPRVIPSCIE